MRTELIVLCCAIALCSSASDSDWSFKEMCEFYEGKDTYVERKNGYKSMRGDRCKFTFQMPFDDLEQATMYCEENVPYHIIGVEESNRNTICEAEATLSCEDEWVQMFGRCYKLVKKMMTRDDAVQTCSSQTLPAGNSKPTIAFMHREALPFRIYDYFRGVSRLWLDASIAITKDLIYDKGDNLLLAIDGYPFNLPNIALARVEPTVKAMALCEYTPRMNQAESNYLLKRYGEIYYETIFTDKAAYVRSASVLARSDKDKLRDNAYCKAVLFPFIRTKDSQSAVPVPEFLEKLKTNQKAEIIRTSVYSADAKKYNRIDKLCANADISRNYGMDFPSTSGSTLFQSMSEKKLIWRKDEPNEKCDGATWSTGIVLSRSSAAGLEAMSDARWAPIYCQTTFDIVEYGGCEPGWTPFLRDNGQTFCHKFFSDLSTFDNAERKCLALKAHVTGFSSLAELDVLDKMMNDARDNDKVIFDDDHTTWVGAKRRTMCTKEMTNGQTSPGYNDNIHHPCSTRHAFQWINGVAENPPVFENNWERLEPNLSEDDSHCIELLKGSFERYQWLGTHRDKGFNDIWCHNPSYFFCGKEAEVKFIKKSD